MFVKSAVNEAEYVMKHNKVLGGGYSPKPSGVTLWLCLNLAPFLERQEDLNYS